MVDLKIKSIICVLVILLLILVGCAPKIVGNDGLIEKAREEINVSDSDTIELTIAGESVIEDRHLFWFISGNQYQSHRYVPIEFVSLGDDEYKFVKEYQPVERAADIFVLMWDYGYSILVNNPECNSIIITDSLGKSQAVTIDILPFVHYYKGIPSEYFFLDKDGKALN